MVPRGAVPPQGEVAPTGTIRPMAAIVRVPTALRTLTAGEAEVEVEASTVGEVIDALEAAHPGFKARLTDDDGALRRFVNVFVADDDIRYLQGVGTPVVDGQVVSIIPAVAGGALGA
jgi:sulfur-carrier protein